MPLDNFNLVLTGANFPVASIRVSDFQFRHRELREKLRLPVALQAERDNVVLQILPNRFDVAVTKPDQLEKQVLGVQELVETFFEYVGRRTIEAVGHNAQWILPGTADRKDELIRGFLNVDIVGRALGTEVFSSDVTLYFNQGAEKRARVLVSGEAPGDVVLDYNFHFDVPGTLSAPEAVKQLSNSLQHVETMSERVTAVMLAGGVEA